LVSTPEISRFSGGKDWIDFDFVESDDT